MNKIFSIALMALVFASCQNSEDNAATDSVSADSISMSVAPTPAADSGSLNAMVNSAQPATTTTTTPAAGGSGAVNPPHGAPGHRCEIAVGAPLNSPAGSTPTAAPAASPAPIMMQQGQGQSSAPVMAQPSSAAGKGQRLNPPHGAPGHDCAVAVGAPLKS